MKKGIFGIEYNATISKDFVVGDTILLSFIVFVVPVIIWTITCCICLCWVKRKAKSQGEVDSVKDELITDDQNNTTNQAYEATTEHTPKTVETVIQEDLAEGMYDSILDTTKNKTTKGSSGTDSNAQQPPPAPPPPPLVAGQSSNTMVYAVVDKSKKSKKSNEPQNVQSSAPKPNYYDDVVLKEQDNYNVLKHSTPNQQQGSTTSGNQAVATTGFYDVVSTEQDFSNDLYDKLAGTGSSQTPNFQLGDPLNNYDVVNI